MTAIRQDPTEAFADLLDNLDRHVKTSSRRARLDEVNRINLLFGHAIFAIAVAPGFTLLAYSGMTGPSYMYLRRIPGIPWTMAALIGVAGLTLAVATWHRNRPWEYGAIVAMLTWYGTVSVTFLAALIAWIAAPGPTDWLKAPSGYAWIVYAHIFYALAAHARTLHRKGLRSPARPPR